MVFRSWQLHSGVKKDNGGRVRPALSTATFPLQPDKTKANLVKDLAVLGVQNASQSATSCHCVVALL